MEPSARPMKFSTVLGACRAKRLTLMLPRLVLIVATWVCEVMVTIVP
jgi:hypothetical protein